MGSEVLTLETCIDRIQASSDELEMIAAIDLVKQFLRVDSAVFVTFIREDVSTESYRFLMSCDTVYCGLYRRAKWFVNDPAISYAALNSAPRLLRDMPCGLENADIVELAKQHGFNTGGVFPAPSPGSISRMGVLIVGTFSNACADTWFASMRSAGRVIAMELLEWSIGQVRQSLISEARLTEEDISLLRFERSGMGSKEIAPRLNATPQAIDGKFQRLLPRIGANTRKNAARIAYEAGLLS